MTKQRWIVEWRTGTWWRCPSATLMSRGDLLPCEYNKEEDAALHVFKKRTGMMLVICPSVYIIKKNLQLFVLVIIWPCLIMNCMHSFIVLLNKYISPYLNRLFYYNVWHFYQMMLFTRKFNLFLLHNKNEKLWDKAWISTSTIFVSVW